MQFKNQYGRGWRLWILSMEILYPPPSMHMYMKAMFPKMFERQDSVVGSGLAYLTSIKVEHYRIDSFNHRLVRDKFKYSQGQIHIVMYTIVHVQFFLIYSTSFCNSYISFI